MVYLKGEDGVHTTEPLSPSMWGQLEFSVSTEYSGLKYNSKYQMTIEGGHGSERINASRTTLSKYNQEPISPAKWHQEASNYEEQQCPKQGL